MNLSTLHLKRIAKHQIQDPPIPSLSTHGALGENNVGLLDHTSDDNDRTPNEGFVLDLFVKGFPSANMKYSRNKPFDISGETGKHHRMVGPAESFHI